MLVLLKDDLLYIIKELDTIFIDCDTVDEFEHLCYEFYDNELRTSLTLETFWDIVNKFLCNETITLADINK